MIRKFNEMSTKAYLKALGFFQDLKEDQRGLSGVVVAVMLILVAVLAVAALWKLLNKQLTDWWKNIVSKSSTIK